MLFTMCMGLRLARFNVASDDEDSPEWKAHFFTGVPAPAGAGLVLLPGLFHCVLGFSDAEYQGAEGSIARKIYEEKQERENSEPADDA